MATLEQRLRFRLDHRWFPGRISAYLDGDLGPRGRARADRHLGLCPQCRRLLHGVREMLDRLRAHPPARDPAPAELVPAVRARVREAGGGERPPAACATTGWSRRRRLRRRSG